MNAHEELTIRRRFHKSILREVTQKLLKVEVALIALRHLARCDWSPLCQFHDRLASEHQAECKALRRQIRREYTILAALGLWSWSRSEGRALVGLVVRTRAEARAVVRKVQAEIDAEDALDSRLRAPSDVLAN
jgi:hypothetical protein